MRPLAALLFVASACESPQAHSVDAPAVQPQPEIEVAPLEGEAAARLRHASNTLATEGCVPEALEVVRSLHRVYGDEPRLVEALRAAFEACNDPDALGELLARTLPGDAPASERLELGATWIRAARYDAAVAVLEPLAGQEGSDSEAAWLTGFALLHAGEQERALPLLESARRHAAPNASDAWLLIGLCKLETGDVEGATAELEAGARVFGNDPFLWTALARAYTAGGRPGDAARAEAEATTTRTARGDALRSQMWLAARAMELRKAAEANDVEAVDRVYALMWDEAPADLRRQMVGLRARVQARAGRSEWE